MVNLLLRVFYLREKKLRINDKAINFNSKLQLTEQGFLVAKGVKIAKVGVLDYLGEEIGQAKGKIYKVGVTKEQLFNPKTIESFEGKPITLIHPRDLEVNAKTWKKEGVGHAQNIKPDGEYLTADVYISDAGAIQKIHNHNIKQFSLGYDCDLVVADSESSDFKKTNIKGNHVAIVPSGRCGGSCRLGDNKGTSMSKKTTLLDSLKKTLGLIKVNDNGQVVLNEDETKQLQELLASLQAQLEKQESLPDNQKDQTEINELKVKIEELTKKLADKEGEKEVEKTVTDGSGELENLKKENAALKGELEKLKNANATTSALNDAKARFPKVKFGDTNTARGVYEAVLADNGVFSKEQLANKTDLELSSAYAGLCASKQSGLGKKLLGDSSPKKADFNEMFGGN